MCIYVVSGRRIEPIGCLRQNHTARRRGRILSHRQLDRAPRRSTAPYGLTTVCSSGQGRLHRVKCCPQPLSTLISRRPFSTSPKSGSTAEQSSEQDIAIEEAKRPRWSYTPPAAKAPFSLRARKHPEYRVNEDPAVLDQFYVRLLGDGGEKVLQDELKWLAVTHKSFDQGRRGFNDRLAFLGKNIVQLQASLALVQNGEAVSQIDKYGRTPFTHPATQGLRNLSSDTKSFLTDRTKLADLAMQRYNMEKVIRWNPRDPTNLEGSGLELVLAHSLYAVVGAVAMEKGGQYANEVAKERILAPLGVKVA
ncbi:hypothetical protein N7470_006298 [Penicillium chermesinum]|nr:hypothetical protein N7470_006298 [Penicillium chermesinum]